MNAIVSLRLTLDIPESVIERMVGHDDGSDAYHERALNAVEAAIVDDSVGFLDYVISEDVEVDG